MTEKELKDQNPPDNDRLMDHAYDGIQEYDNPMPSWWINIFWGTIVFSILYFFNSVAGSGKTVAREYQHEMSKLARAQAAEGPAVEVTEEELEALLSDEKMKSQGADVFSTRCAACHLAKGEGSIGPNLTDNAWIHGGGTLAGIYKIVAEGSLQKGMPAWNRQLSADELKAVVVHVGGLRGTNVPGKPPEGEVVP